MRARTAFLRVDLDDATHAKQPSEDPGSLEPGAIFTGSRVLAANEDQDGGRHGAGGFDDRGDGDWQVLPVRGR